MSSAVINGDGNSYSPGISATKFYRPTDPGLHIDIFASSMTKESYGLPGPQLYNGAASASQSKNAIAMHLQTLFHQLSLLPLALSVPVCR